MISTEKSTEKKFRQLKQNFCYAEIGELITHSLLVNSNEFNRIIFGYIPANFREIEISSDSYNLDNRNIFIGEPVIYKIFFPFSLTMRGIPYFYIFCYLKKDCKGLNVFFQSASKSSKRLFPKHYNLLSKKINFEGIISGFGNNLSCISISDPGHFIPGLYSSFYAGTPELNFAQAISTMVEKIANLANIELKDVFLFGSSAGGMGALLSSTYFSSKVQVMSVNAQISTHTISAPMKTLLGTDNPEYLIDKFSNRVCCIHRFQENINSVPNMFLSANTNDKLYQKNYKFYQLYRQLFSGIGKNNQSVFDSYCGVNGHGRPDKKSLKIKIRIAREILTLDSNIEKLDNNKSAIIKNSDLENINSLIIKNNPKGMVRKEYIKFADSLLRDKRFEESIYFYSKALNLNSNHPKIYFSLGNALLNTGELDKAINCYRKGIEIDYNSPGAFKKMGDAFKQKDNLDEAIICYQKALEIKPSLFNICNLIGNIFTQQNKHQEAKQYYDLYQKLRD